MAILSRDLTINQCQGIFVVFAGSISPVIQDRSITYRQKKPGLNSTIYGLYSSGMTLRRMAIVLGVNKNTVTRKFDFIAGSNMTLTSPRHSYDVFYRHAKVLKDSGETWMLYTDRLASIDWSCEADIWSGTLCQPDAKGVLRVLTNQNLIRQAINKVKEAIGLVHI